MKFRNYLDTITDIGIYPLVSLIMFVVFFVGLLIHVLALSKKEVKRMGNMPLEDGTVRVVLLLFFFTFIGGGANAQSTDEAAGSDELLLYTAIIALFFVLLLFGAILIQTLRLARRVTGKLDPEGKDTSLFAERWWDRFKGINYSLSEEEQMLIKEHDYDGIQELDNRMPPWLSFLFQATIVFAVVYMLIYHVFRVGDLPQAELEKELQAAAVVQAAFLEKEGARVDENSVVLSTAPGDIANGKSLYITNCAACHAEDGGGTVGPNLTDKYWIHGGSINDVFKVIKYGVPEKGMIAWEKQLKPQEIQHVASFIVAELVGSTPAVAKEPQGEEWVVSNDKPAEN